MMTYAFAHSQSLTECSADFQTKDDDAVVATGGEWAAIAATVNLYLVLGLMLLAVFEIARGKRSVYSRRTSKLRHRAPALPGRWPLQWLIPVLNTGDDECRRMVSSSTNAHQNIGIWAGVIPSLHPMCPRSRWEWTAGFASATSVGASSSASSAPSGAALS